MPIVSYMAAQGCRDCWVLGKNVMQSHHNQDHPYLLLLHLQAKQRTENVYWPSCYLCWIPFQAPCSHPSIRWGNKIKTDDCPFPSIYYLISVLCSIIYNDDNPSRSFYLHAAFLSLNLPLTMSCFIDWVTKLDSPPLLTRYLTSLSF